MKVHHRARSVKNAADPDPIANQKRLVSMTAAIAAPRSKHAAAPGLYRPVCYVLFTFLFVAHGCRSADKTPTQNDSKAALSNTNPTLTEQPTPAVASLYFADTVALPPEFAFLAKNMEMATHRVWKVPDKNLPWVEDLSAEKGGFEVRVRVLYGLFRDGDQVWTGEGSLYAAVVAEAKRPRRGMTPEKATAEARVEEPFLATMPLQDALVAMVEKSQAQARTSLIAVLRVQRGTDDEVVNALMSEDESVALSAAAQALSRKLTKSVSIFEKWLTDANTEKTMVAIQTLGALGDETALKPLAAVVGHHDPDVVRQAVWAIAEVGGEKAQQYLEDIAEGHAYPTIRELAKSLLTRH